MDSFDFPEKIPIDAARTLDQLTGRFQSVKDGLPELVKNSKDQYSRLHVSDFEIRQILVISSTKLRNLAVIDFAGAPAKNFEGWTNWSDPNAGQIHKAADIEAGHGNGGKAFMVRGAQKSAYLDSCYKGKRTKKGFVNNREAERYKPGFAISSGVKISDIDEANPKLRLEEILASLGLTFAQIPDKAQRAFHERRSFTAAYLEGVNEWQKRRKDKLKNLTGEKLTEVLSEHGQTAMTIATCQVWVIRDGEVIGDQPVKPAEILPYPGFEQPVEIEIPEQLTDPETEELVSVYEHGEQKGYLKLYTSDTQLQISATNRAKNVIRIWNERNNVATWTLQELHSISASSYIYGELRCTALQDEHLEGATRQHLADTQLVRALKEWTSEHVQYLAENLHRSITEKTTPKDQERAKNALSDMRDLMRRFLDPSTSGNWNDANADDGSFGVSGNGQNQPRGPVEYGNTVNEILLEEQLRDPTLITGTKIPLHYRCIERAEDGSVKPVKNVNVLLQSDPPNMFVLNSDGTLTATVSGLGKIRLSTDDGSVVSAPRAFWTMDAHGVEMHVPNEPLKQGQRVKSEITFKTDDGPITHCLIEGKVLNPDLASMGRNGRMKIGYQEGPFAVRIKFGSSLGDYQDFTFDIGSEVVEPPEGTGDSGEDIPQILLCGDSVPGMENQPPESRTIPPAPELPTIIEDEFLFPGIVWINQASRESVRVRSSSGGSRGIGNVSSKTYMNFVALKCFDILKRLKVRQEIKGQRITENEFMQLAVEAEMECAGFIDAAWEMMDNLLGQESKSDEK